MSSLSNKLRELRKSLKKSKKQKGNASVFDDDQLRVIARRMPRDTESLGQILSDGQLDAFGDAILDVTRAHTSRDQAQFEECILEIGAFTRGGLPGMDLLNRVYPNILKHFRVADDVDEVFDALGIYMNYRQNRLKRKHAREEEEDPLCSKRARLDE